MKKKVITISEFIIITVLIVIVVNIWTYWESVPTSSPYIFSKKWGQFNEPTTIAVSSSGKVYVGDYRDECIKKFDSSGNFIARWKIISFENIEDNSNSRAGGIGSVCTDLNDNIYFTNDTNACALKLNSEGKLVHKWWKGDGEGSGFTFPEGITVDRTGNIYVVDIASVLQKFDSNINFIKKWRVGWDVCVIPPPRNRDVVVDSKGYVYVLHWLPDSGYIFKYDSYGKFVKKWGAYDNAVDVFNDARGIAIDDKDRIFVAETGKNRILVSDTDGNFIMEWGSYGFCNGYFRGPVDVALDLYGNVYVVEEGNKRVQKFRPNPDYKLNVNRKEKK